MPMPGALVVLDNVLDVHCFGAGNFSTHQIGAGSRTDDAGGLQLVWTDGPMTTTGAEGEGAPLHWSVWRKKKLP